MHSFWVISGVHQMLKACSAKCSVLHRVAFLFSRRKHQRVDARSGDRHPVYPLIAYYAAFSTPTVLRIASPWFQRSIVTAWRHLRSSQRSAPVGCFLLTIIFNTAVRLYAANLLAQIIRVRHIMPGSCKWQRAAHFPVIGARFTCSPARTRNPSRKPSILFVTVFIHNKAAITLRCG